MGIPGGGKKGSAANFVARQTVATDGSDAPGSPCYIGSIMEPELHRPQSPIPAPSPPFLDALNESQRAAVDAIDGPVLVLAGAGTGKTRVLTARLAHILALGRARPWQVLAVTFTNKAAREMRDRVAGLLGRPVEGWWVGTFHSVGARILRAHAEALDLTPTFTILDADDQLRLVGQLLEARGMDTKRTLPRVVLAAIQRWKDRGLTPDRVSTAEGADVADGQAVAVYAEYQQRLRTVNAADFGDLLLHCLTLFRERPEILARYQEQFRYVLVDEYQDTNVAQYLWLRALAQSHHNLCCVGDDDQSIYSWRGAEVGNILRFEKDFPGAQVIRLERNYRSTPHILAAASGLIITTRATWARPCGPTWAKANRWRSAPFGTPRRRREPPATPSSPCAAAAIRSTRWRYWSALDFRPASSKSG